MNNRYHGERIILSDHARSYIPIRGYEPAEVEQAIKETEGSQRNAIGSMPARTSRSTLSGMANFTKRNKFALFLL